MTSYTTLKGIPASKGKAEGIARIVFDPSHISRLNDGDILVAPYTTPEWMEEYERISGIVTDGGNVSSHAARVARQFGIPCVVGTQNATEYIRNGEKIIVDGTKGEVSYRLD